MSVGYRSDTTLSSDPVVPLPEWQDPSISSGRRWVLQVGWTILTCLEFTLSDHRVTERRTETESTISSSRSRNWRPRDQVVGVLTQVLWECPRCTISHSTSRLLLSLMSETFVVERRLGSVTEKDQNGNEVIWVFGRKKSFGCNCRKKNVYYCL